MVISFLSLKGGVGKTTFAANVAVDLAHRWGKRVLLLDGNYSAPNLGIHMDILCPGMTIHDVLAGRKFEEAIYSQYGVDVIPGNFLYPKEVKAGRLKKRLATFKRSYDFVIIDSSPSLNGELSSAMDASDELFMVSTPDYPTLSCTIKLARLARVKGKRIAGLLVNRISDERYQLSLNEIQESTNIPVLSMFREDAMVLKALDARIPLSLFAPHSSFSGELHKLTDALIGVREQRSSWKQFFNSSLTPAEVNRNVLREHFYTSIFRKRNGS